jgi:hypothetical protein
MERDIMNRLARHAANFGAEFDLKIHKTRAVRCTFRLGKSDPYAHNLHRRMFVATDDHDADVCLRDLLRQVERAMGVSWETRTAAIDPAIAADAERQTFLEGLDPAQRLRAQAICRSWHDFKSETMSGWRAQDVEPRLADPRSSLGNCIGEVG